MNGIRKGLLWGGVVAGLVIVGSLVPDSRDSSPGDSAPELEEAMGSAGSSPTDPVEDESVSESASDETSAPEPEADPSPSLQSAPDSARPGTALEMLATIEVKGRAPKTGFDRELRFGEAWIDVDLNGCDTRNDVLRRDLDAISVDSSCRVQSGKLRDPFSAEDISFLRGETTSILVQIDHVVSLSNAWQTGAQQLDQSARIELANDPLNLIAVSGRLNAQKGDGDAATWLPPHRGFWCEYVARQVGVKAHYDLWMTQSEYDRIGQILSDCPEFPALTPEDHGQYRPGAIPWP